METIISSLISAGVALLICVIQNNKTQSLIQYQLAELQKHVDKHNNLIERTYQLEKNSALHDERIDSIEKDIADIKKGA